MKLRNKLASERGINSRKNIVEKWDSLLSYRTNLCPKIFKTHLRPMCNQETRNSYSLCLQARVGEVKNSRHIRALEIQVRRDISLFTFNTSSLATKQTTVMESRHLSLCRMVLLNTKSLKYLACIREVSCSNIGPDTVSWTRGFMVFISLSRKILRQYFKEGHESFHITFSALLTDQPPHHSCNLAH
jgi:hypothetical protein